MFDVNCASRLSVELFRCAGEGADASTVANDDGTGGGAARQGARGRRGALYTQWHAAAKGEGMTRLPWRRAAGDGQGSWFVRAGEGGGTKKDRVCEFFWSRGAARALCEGKGSGAGAVV